MGTIKKVMKFSIIFSLGLSGVMTGVCYLLCGRSVGMFLMETDAFEYAVKFTSILLTTSIFFGVFYVLSNALQAMGAAKEAFVINISRQGIIYIPSIFILQIFLGALGLVWAQPVADLLSTLFVVLLYLRTVKKLMRQP